MPGSYVRIQSVTVTGSTQASIEFTSIPNTFDDLIIKLSGRDNRPQDFNGFVLSPNGSSTGFTSRNLIGDGTSASSQTRTDGIAGVANSNTSTSSTFANIEIYIPNYTGNQNKIASIDSVSERNATYAESWLIAWQWSNTAAITSLTLTPSAGASWVQNSTAILYGIKRN